MLVTLPASPAGAEGFFSGGWKNGSFFHELSAAGGAVTRGGAGTGVAAGLAALVLKNCVKLPSPDAEPETPGDENPLELEGTDEGGAGTGVSCEGRAGGAYDGGTPETKIFVNSPEGESAGAGAGLLTTCVGTCGAACLAGGATEGRGASELNIEVNSPGPDPCAEPVPGCGAADFGGTGAALAGRAGSNPNGSSGLDSFFAS